MPDVKPCDHCKNSGLIEIPTSSRTTRKRHRRERSLDERDLYSQKICPSCGGSSNPALGEALKERQEQDARKAAAARREGQDRHHQIAAKRKRERAARRKARKR